MDDTLNYAAQRLLSVVLDMLRHPDADKKPEDARYPPPQFRCTLESCEAAWRAANEAREMLRSALPKETP